ncbi:u3 small nucleolar rna-associated protein [Ophiostoma piceae UAMH 11346]|uniref:U3 small nucleolar rna-associated protein n=1 Tax=Ophiostoma piceae (strain UAMH 11346) TaxID=1262450 RepID=S3CAB3_OPHP1|nr:u3 small nucleolar rna-associated protein [Ophiostoma piceae UAMH 11346]
MDIHRCRFINYEASGINTVAFSHPHLPTNQKHSRTAPVRMAIGRENGDIEIWNPMQGTWLQEMTIKGGQGRSVESLAWVVGDDEELDDAGTNKGKPILIHGQLRLFSIGFTNTITEWDLEKGCVKRNASGQHGDLWCLATQPKPAPGTPTAEAATTQRLVGGTIDGCLALYSTDDDDLRFQRLCRLPKKNIKVVSIAFQTRQLAVAGCSDGTIRVFDIRNGAILHAMTIGRDLAGEKTIGQGAKNVIVWSVRCLPNGDIVSGDSTGQICIWDGKTYTQAQRIQSHTQDVLSLTISADGSDIISGGMDRRVVLYREIPGQALRWAKVWHRRYNQHDVKALAAFEAKGMSVVVAGGPDAAPVILPLEKSGMEHHRTLSHLPQTVPIASAPAARLMICWWQRQVQIWAFDAPIDQLLNDGETEADLERNRRQVGCIIIKGDNNIVAADISADGSFVVITTTVGIKAFQLRKLASGEVSVSKISVPASVASKGGADSVAISPNGKWVCLASGVDDRVNLIEVVYPEPTAAGADSKAKIAIRPKVSRVARLRRNIPRHELLSGLGRYDRRITHIAFSPDSKLLATADLAGYIDTWVLQGPDGMSGTAAEAEGEGEGEQLADVDSEDSDSSSDEDSDAEVEDTAAPANKWVRNPRAKQLPKLPSAPTTLTFSPDVPGAPAVAGEAVSSEGSLARDYVLFAITASHRLFAFHPLQARLVPWMRRLSPTSLPVEYRNIRDVAKGVLWQGPRVWIYGASFLFMVDTSVEPTSSASPSGAAASGEDQSSKSAVATQQDLTLRKRKRSDDTGAGNRMELGRIAPQRVQMAVENAEGGGREWVDVDMEDVQDDAKSRADDDDDDETDSEAEAEYPAYAEQQQQLDDGKSSKALKKAARKQRKRSGDASNGQQLQAPQPQQPRWWHTFKYRPILGVVPLSTASSSSTSSSAAYPQLEVALVERPGWEIDLPVRYDE